MTEDEHTSQGRERQYELLADFTHPDGRVNSTYYRAEKRQEALHAPNAISSVRNLGDLLNDLYVHLRQPAKSTLPSAGTPLHHKSEVHAFSPLTTYVCHPSFDCGSSDVCYVATSALHRLFPLVCTNR
jgi:hypothetical protein